MKFTLIPKMCQQIQKTMPGEFLTLHRNNARFVRKIIHISKYEKTHYVEIRFFVFWVMDIFWDESGINGKWLKRKIKYHFPAYLLCSDQKSDHLLCVVLRSTLHHFHAKKNFSTAFDWIFWICTLLKFVIIFVTMIFVFFQKERMLLWKIIIA